MWFVQQRAERIAAFRPEEFWQIELSYSGTSDDGEALTARFSGRIDVLPWQGGASPDVERAARDWSRAALVFGPHGAGLANVIFARLGVVLVELKTGCTGRGGPQTIARASGHLPMHARKHARSLRTRATCADGITDYVYRKYVQMVRGGFVTLKLGTDFKDEPVVSASLARVAHECIAALQLGDERRRCAPLPYVMQVYAIGHEVTARAHQPATSAGDARWT